MTPQEMDARIVRYGELMPCRTAFIDAHTPGSDQKENFTIIGGGVSESVDQHVHIAILHGFNIGAAGQPPKCRNSLHSHRTAEVFFVLSGRWRFFWGRWGDAGEVVLQPGDIFNIPTGIFRGFENIGTDYGMIMAILGGDDAGGGVIWAPQVIDEAASHGLVLSPKRARRCPMGSARCPCSPKQSWRPTRNRQPGMSCPITSHAIGTWSHWQTASPCW
jgi:mannose-6-phosphate isomerase-like protein (cupin superfamily)